MTMQIKRLRAETLINIGFDFLWLEMPKVIPFVPIFATFYLKAWTLLGTNLGMTSRYIANAESLRDYCGFLADYQETTKSGREIWLEIKQASIKLLKDNWGEAPEEDVELWEVLDSDDADKNDEDGLRETILTLDFIDIWQAFSGLELARMKRIEDME